MEVAEEYIEVQEETVLFSSPSQLVGLEK